MHSARTTRQWQIAIVVPIALALVLVAHGAALAQEPDPVQASLVGGAAAVAPPASALAALPAFPRTWSVGDWATLKLRGRIDTDFLWTNQSPGNLATFGDQGSAGLRRARIGAEGRLGTSGRYIAEIDLASGVVVPRDVFAGFGKVDETGERRIGHFREPFSLEGGTSANTLAFMERSPVNLLDPGRNWGLGLFRANPNEKSTFAAGVFHAGTDSGDFQGGDGSTVGFTSRLTVTPINEGDGERLLHFGLSTSERVPESGVIIINQKPANPLLQLGDSSESPFVPTIRIPAHFQELINVQCAWADGPLWAQSEWYGTLIDQTGAGTVFFHGCYASCGYFLTGEHRAYQSSSGVLGAVKVDRPFLTGPAGRDREHGWGAWELTWRFAYLDFFDSHTPTGTAGQLVGITLPTATLGVNWYLADHVRLLFNYSYQVPDEPNTGTSSANLFAMRLNVFF